MDESISQLVHFVKSLRHVNKDANLLTYSKLFTKTWGMCDGAGLGRISEPACVQCEQRDLAVTALYVLSLYGDVARKPRAYAERRANWLRSFCEARCR